ncbi:hypothetical protein [Thiolapillus brandeum]|uniref:Uncharacterized protein n=1 Tax=Thiolapillus brandeum TaxID=1076588 RepID=A0A7U6JI98_9GAMM|nr:hypothetical protein [Thiolapillus brandeum]BAO45309.1 hypothetical protein TBH_C2399 [Thiolapillus brandeum]
MTEPVGKHPSGNNPGDGPGDRPGAAETGGGRKHLAWLVFFAIILLLALASTWALLRGSRQLAEKQLPQAAPPVQRLLYVVLNGRRYVVPEDGRQALSRDLEERLDTRDQQQWLDTQIDSAVEAAFVPVHDRVGDFADWYYSLTGEYLRYAHAIGGDMGDYLEDKLRETVFLPAALDTNLDNLFESLNTETAARLRHTGVQLTDNLELLLKAHARPLRPGEPLIGDTLDLDALLVDSLSVSTRDMNRQLIAALTATGTGVVVAKGLGAVVMKKTLAKVAGTKTFNLAASLLGKLAAKSAVKGGGVLAGAGTGAALCSPTGPGAVVCGAVGGLVAWLVVDKVAIELDEALNRDRFEADIHRAIDEQQAQLKQQLLEIYGGLLAKRLAPLRESAQDLGISPGKRRPIDAL